MEKLQFRARCVRTQSTTTFRHGEVHQADFESTTVYDGGLHDEEGAARVIGGLSLSGGIQGEFSVGRDYVFTAKELP